MATGSERFQNNFDFLRLFAALAVIFSHSYNLLGFADPIESLTGINSFAGFAVGIFFAISGYLITKSWERDAHTFTYFKKRILRIFPGLIVVTLLTVFVLGPCVTIVSPSDYFTNPLTWNYLKTMLLLPNQGQLPGVFMANPGSLAVNGSLWTLPYEFSLYIMVFALGIIGLLRKRLTVVLLYVLTLCMLPIAIVHPTAFISPIVYFLITPITLFWVINFTAGIILYLHRDKIRLDYKIALLLLLIWVLSFQTAYALYVTSIVLPYLVIYFAFVRIPPFQNIGKNGDFSYGLYIYAFPIQQTVVYFFAGHLTPMLLFGLSLVTVFPAAVLSWFLIESRALKLKDRALTKRVPKGDQSSVNPPLDIDGLERISEEGND